MKGFRKNRSKMERMIRYGSLATAICLLLSFNAYGHSLFILSGRHRVSPGKASPLFFCYGHHFPVDDAVRRKKLNYVRVIAPDQTTTDVTLRDEKSLHSYLIDYETPGTYALTAETNPGYFSIYIDKKGRRRHSFKPMHTYVENAREIKTSMRSSQWAKAYVFCGKPSIPFPARVGLPMELAPATDVSMLKPGDSIEFQVYENGNPYTGQGFWDATYNGFSTESEDMYIQRTPCTSGKFSVPIDAGGRWFIRFFTKTPASETNKNKYLTEKRTATLVFLVRNPRKRPKIDGH